MTAQGDPLLDEVVRFHGHLCPGLAIGFRAAKFALERLGARRSGDEELIAIVENDSCSVDAVQCLCGCTFGKGNLFFKDYGKQVFTLALRPSGQAVRVALKRKDRRGEPPGADRPARTRWLLEAPAEALFDARETTISMPGEAAIRDSVVCSRCGEEAMATRIKKKGAARLCIPCALESK
ncbi:MAG: FmdE family protein [Elusimicrobia bacterium]|nr:FmdE family protein [Elusimicrobiota bacterium]